jgi:chromosome partitioning protein
MEQIIAVANQKGGVGKTTTTLNVAAALAELGRRVTVVDLDPQGHLTEALGEEEARGEANLADALTEKWTGPVEELVVEHSKTEAAGCLKLIAHTDLMFVVGRSLDQMRAREFRLARVLRELVDVDYVLIDCPPTLDILTDNALAAADGVLIPIQAEDSSLRAVKLLLTQIDAVDADLRETPLKLHGFVVSQLRRPPTVLARSVIDKIEADSGLPPVLGMVPQGVVVTEAWRMGIPVVEHAPDSEHATVYRTIARHLDGQEETP